MGAAQVQVHCISSNPSLVSLIAQTPPDAGGARRRLDEFSDNLLPPFAPNIFDCPGPPGGVQAPLAFSAVNLLSMALL